MKSLLRPLLTLLVLAPLASAAAPARPNIILIMADDLSHTNLSVYGAKNFQTPHLDRLAAQGMRFDHCYSLPLCTPSRIAMMTGQHNGRNHVDASYLEKEQRTFGDIAKDAGYATCLTGKWKLSGRGVSLPDRFGFDDYCVTEGTRNDSPRYKNPEILRNGKVTKYSDGEYGPDIVRDHALDFIARHRDRPFFLYYPMVLVHTPISPVPGTPAYATADQRTDEPKNYPAMVQRMDENVGAIVAKLEALGIRERTIVMFTGDNGTKKAFTMEMKDGRIVPGGKGSTSDRGVHVPLIVCQPGTVPTGVNDTLVDFTDFLPTVAEIAGVKLPSDVPCDGTSFLAPALGRKNPKSREWIYQWFANNPKVDKVVETVFDRDYRLYGDGRFYNCSVDLDEKQPLEITKLTGAAQGAHAKLQSALATSRAGFQRPAK